MLFVNSLLIINSMKNLLFLFLLFSLQYSFAQVWVDQGAVWHYDFTGFYDGGFVKLEYNQDTLIDGVTCQKIEYTRSSFTYNQNSELIFLGESSGLSGITYVSGDTVFYRKGEHFFVLYNFGAEVGDSWVIDTTTYNLSPMCGDTSSVEVVETGNIQLNGVDYRTITLETTDDSPYFLEGTFVERFGAVNNSMSGHMLFPRQNDCDPNVIYEYYVFTFKCFQDNSFPLYIPSAGSCEYAIGLDENNYSNGFSVSLYPNPVENELTISSSSLENLNEVLILNVLGEVVEKYAVSSTEKSFDVSHLDNGIYFICLDDGKRLKFIKK